MPRILIADDHDVVRRYIREILEDESGWEVCAEAGTGGEAIVMATAERPDIAILDLSMPDQNGLEAAKEIHRRFPDTALLILTVHDIPELAEEAAAMGVRACLLKSDPYRLIAEIQAVLAQGNGDRPKRRSA